MSDKITEELRVLQDAAENPSGEWAQFRARPFPTVEAKPVAFVDPHSLKFATHYNGVYVATSVDRSDVYSEPVYSAATIAALVAERDSYRDMAARKSNEKIFEFKRALAAERAARNLIDAVTFDMHGADGRGGNGGLISNETLRAADELRLALYRARKPAEPAPGL